MARLSLHLLGALQVTLSGAPVTGFESDKERALLAYLAEESHQAHRREKLAGLLWPDRLESAARNNLRRVLSNLRRLLGDRTRSGAPFLLTDPQTVHLNPASETWLDTRAFSRLLSPGGRQGSAELGEAILLYQGDFLDGFTVAGSPSCEEWILLCRARYQRLMMDALRRLGQWYEQQGNLKDALGLAWKQLELEPWWEEAHQQVMRLLGQSGRRSEALAQYAQCRELLLQELGVEPSAATTRLYRQVRDGQIESSTLAHSSLPTPDGDLPPFLDEEVVDAERPVFVGRERELAYLEGHLEAALAGHGRVVLVAGEAGSGKTALVQESARCAQDAHSELLAASGSCNAYTGIGDPHLPFREILEFLAGGVDTAWASGVMTGRHARRLWQTLPATVEALVKTGPDLIETFIPRAALLERVKTYARWTGEAVWMQHLEPLRFGPGPSADSGSGVALAQASRLFQQYTRVLKTLAAQVPLLLVVDDLQWADAGSLSLLFHLGRQLGDSRILVVGTFRPEDIALGRDGARHPLKAVAHELQRESGDVALSLDGAGCQAFVDALLDSEPNRLGAGFRERLYGQTRGHPLFATELLRGLQESGGLVQDPAGRWVEGPDLDWDMLPARVEAVIAERVGRLPEHLQATLRIASVEGEVFTAEVLARVQGSSEAEVVGCLSGDLDRMHRLVRAQSVIRRDTGQGDPHAGEPGRPESSRRLSQYRFRHILFRRYLYDGLDEVERSYLHGSVGDALEHFYGEPTEAGKVATSIAPQLAWHFRETGLAEKAIQYLQVAGQRAIRLAAYTEGIAHLLRALDLLETLPQTPDRDHIELSLQLDLGVALIGHKAYGPQAEKAYDRARELSQQLGETSQMCRVLSELSVFHYVRAKYPTARELGEAALDLAVDVGDPLLMALGNWCLGTVYLTMGKYETARTHLQEVISFYEPEEHHHRFVSLRGSDVGVSALAHDACCLWALGFADQARKRSQAAMDLAKRLDHGLSRADVLTFGGCLVDFLRRDARVLKLRSEELICVSQESALHSFEATGQCFMGDALSRLGQVDVGVALLCEGLRNRRSGGIECHSSGLQGALAASLALAGRREEAMEVLAGAVQAMEERDERYWEADLHRLKGELLLLQGNGVKAEMCLQNAIEVARSQRARSWELRAATRLARLWREQGKEFEARELLAPVYEWFTEGFDTRDLTEAKALLDELS